MDLKIDVTQNKRTKESKVVLNKNYKLEDRWKGLKNALNYSPERMSYNSPSFTITVTPTSNCQTCAISGIHSLVNIGQDQFDITMKHIYNVSGKRLLIMEVREENLSTLYKNADKDLFLVNAPYKSTSGNNMVMMIYNIEQHTMRHVQCVD